MLKTESTKNSTFFNHSFQKYTKTSLFNFCGLTQCTRRSICLLECAPHAGGIFDRHHLEPEDQGQSMGDSFAQASVKYAQNRGDEHARNRFRKYLKKISYTMRLISGRLITHRLLLMTPEREFINFKWTLQVYWKKWRQCHISVTVGVGSEDCTGLWKVKWGHKIYCR